MDKPRFRDTPGIVIIEPSPDAKCEFCGDVKETRPYGPGCKEICFQYAVKPENIDIVTANARARFLGRVEEC